jgi:hypothetical protein
LILIIVVENDMDAGGGDSLDLLAKLCKLIVAVVIVESLG